MESYRAPHNPEIAADQAMPPHAHVINAEPSVSQEASLPSQEAELVEKPKPTFDEMLAARSIPQTPVADSINDVVIKHKKMWHNLGDYIAYVISDPLHPNFGKRSSAIKTLTEAFANLQRGERVAWGLKDDLAPQAQIISFGFGTNPSEDKGSAF